MKLKNISIKWFVSSFLMLSALFMLLVLGNNSFTLLETSMSQNILLGDSVSLLPVTEELEFAIVFINYDNAIIDINAISSYLPSTLALQKAQDSLTYPLRYSFLFANDSYTQDFLAFIDTIANTNENTSKLNMTALNAQAVDGHPRKIFLTQEGTAIPAESVEEWFHQNPYYPQADYQYYVLNLSYFDANDHSREHWFTVKEIDPDSGVQRHWWRNEWDFPINFDAKFPYAGYGSKYRDYFFDPFAFQWYMKWDLTWRGYNPSLRPYYQKDLDQYLRDGGNINRYLGTWLADLMEVHPYVWQPYFGNSIAIQLVIFQNVSHLGLTNSDLEWVVNITHFQSVMKELIPHATVSINVTIKEFSTVPEITNFFAASEVTYSGDPPIPSYRYYSGFTLWNYLWTNSFKERVFSDVNADVVVNGFAFIIDNATFAEPGMWAGGGLYTGLGGGGQMIQLMELDRLFYPNRTTPRQGFSRVVIHETGHAIGFPHTFNTGQIASDFIGDVMGYYPGIIRYSKIRMEAFQRHAVNILIDDEINPLLDQVNTLDPPLNQSILSEISGWLQNISKLREEHQYISAWNQLLDLKDFIIQVLEQSTTTTTTTTRESTTIVPVNQSTSSTEATSVITGNNELLVIFPASLGLLLACRSSRRLKNSRCHQDEL